MEDKRLTFLEHLEELRRRILIVALAVFVTGSICFYFAWPIMHILAKPAGNLKLVYLSPLEPFMVKIKIAIFGGLFLALPIILYEILAFVAPALKEHEKKLIYPTVFFLVILFAAGVVFGYYFIMPVGTRWLLNQAAGEITASVTASNYSTYAGWFLLAFGISFETPLFILLLVRFGVLSPETLRKNWRYALLLILLIAAIITPDWNPVTMIIMAAPMTVFYFASILLARFVKPKTV